MPAPKAFILNAQNIPLPLTAASILLEHGDGSQMEIDLRNHGPNGIGLYGGRITQPGMTRSQMEALTKAIAVYPAAANQILVGTSPLTSGPAQCILPATPDTRLKAQAVDIRGDTQTIYAQAILVEMQDGSALGICLSSERGHFLRIGGYADKPAAAGMHTEKSRSRRLQVLPLGQNLIEIRPLPAGQARTD
jgi:hypothetical protein